MFYLILVALVLFFLLYFLLKDLYLIYVEKFPPGPLSVPLLGNLHLLSMKTPHLDMDKVIEKYGKILSFRMGPMGRMVFLQDINHINQILENPNAHDRPDMPIFDVINRGSDGIGSCKYNQRWKIMTKTLHKGLAKISSNSVQTVTMHALEQLFERFSNSSKQCWYSPRSDVIAGCSAMFSSIIYGIQPESLDSRELKTRIHYHSKIMSILNPTHPFNLFPWLWKIPSAFRTEISKCLHERESLFDKSFETHAEKFDGTIGDVFDIIAQFEQAKDLNETQVKKGDLFISAWAMYMAGCDTTTDTTLWTMLYLCVYQDLQTKIQAEIDSVIKDNQTNIIENKSSLHYTRATILESMRMSSPVALGLPRVLTEDIYIDNFSLPKGTQVMINQWNVHHDSQYWPEPSKFKPERFLDENGELLSSYWIFQKMPFIPFSRGKRPCIGQHLALDILLVYFTSLLKKFTISLPENYEPDLVGNVLFNLRPNDYPIVFTER